MWISDAILAIILLALPCQALVAMPDVADPSPVSQWIDMYRYSIAAVTVPRLVLELRRQRLWQVSPFQPQLQWRTVVLSSTGPGSATPEPQTTIDDATLQRRSINDTDIIDDKISLSVQPLLPSPRNSSPRPFQADDFAESDLIILSSSSRFSSPNRMVTSDTAPLATRQLLVVSLTSAGHLFRQALSNNTAEITLNRDVWVTLVPQLRDFCRGYVDADGDALKPLVDIRDISTMLNATFPSYRGATDEADYTNPSKASPLALRLQQYLGLPPELPTQRADLVSFWIDPVDLIRPCVDLNPRRSSCNRTLLFRSASDGKLHLETLDDDAASDEIETYSWFADMATNTRMYGVNDADWMNAYPWSRLGFTFDWSKRGKDAVGASEFVLRSGAKVTVNSVDNLENYCSG